MTAILHTASGAALPVQFEPKRLLTKFQYSNAIKKSFNNAGMKDPVISVEITD